jgi:putative aldouronate transport system substrate-binding protein
MNKKTIGTATLSTLLLMSGILSACGAKEEVNNHTTTGAQATPQSPVKLSMMLSAAKPMPDAKEDLIKQELDKKLNIDLTTKTFLPDDQKNQLNIGLANGSSSDIFFVNRQDFVRLAKQDLLLDLTPYMEKLQPTINFVGKNNLAQGQYNGKSYGIPQTERAYQYSYWVRKDWMDKLGLQAPKTTDEFLAFVKAMTEGDPDGDGKKDTFGFSGRPNEALGPLFGAFGTTYPGSFYVKDGKLVNSIYDPAMKEALTYMKQLFDNKVVDPDFLANTKLQHKDKALQEQLGLFYFNWPNVKEEEYKKVNPQSEWVQIDPPQGPAGKGGYAKDATGTILAIPKTAEKDKAKVEKIVELLNYVSSPEGSKLVMYGMKDVNYTEENGNIVIKEALKDTNGYGYQLTGRDEMAYLKNKFPTQEKVFTFAANQPFIQVYDGLISPPDGFVLADAKRFIEEELWKFLYGKNPLESYGDFIKKLEDTFKYKLYMDEAEKQLKEQGVVK